MRRRKGTLVVAPRAIPDMLSSKRSKRRDAVIVAVARDMMGATGPVQIHDRRCSVTPVSAELEDGVEGECTCIPLALRFGARA